ncbi:MAG: hypothetical protein F8N37_07460 [Telmatospirillum sp.]|nr:hypothetical protein [Telmatospirillum sp.]
MKFLMMTALLLLPAAVQAAEKRLECSSWPINIAIGQLKNAGIADPSGIDESKTRAVLLSSEKIGKDLYQQVYEITFQETSGKIVQVVTNSRASREECSMSDVTVYVVSQKLN